MFFEASISRYLTVERLYCSAVDRMVQQARGELAKVVGADKGTEKAVSLKVD